MRKLLLTFAICSLVLFAFPSFTEAAPLSQTTGVYEILIPAVRNSSAVIYVHNNTNNSATIVVDLKSIEDDDTSSYTTTIGAKATAEISDASTTLNFSICNYEGCAAKITGFYFTGTAGFQRSISAVVHNYYDNGTSSCSAASSAVKKGDTASTVYLPEVIVPGSQVYVQNAGDSSNTSRPAIKLYNGSGGLACTVPGSAIDSKESYVFNITSCSGETGTFSAKVYTYSGETTTWAVDAHQISYPRHGSYLGSTNKTSGQLALPVLFKKAFAQQWSSSFTLQSPQSTNQLAIALTEQTSTSGNPAYTVGNISLGASQYKKYNLNSDIVPTGLNTWAGSGYTSGASVYGIITEKPYNSSYKGYRNLSGISYGAATTEVVLPYMPVNHTIGSIPFSASFTVQNLESDSVNMTFHLYNASGNEIALNMTCYPNTSSEWLMTNNAISVPKHQVRRCYLADANSGQTLTPGVYSMHIESTGTSSGKIGAIGHVVGESANGFSPSNSDLETAYVGMSN